MVGTGHGPQITTMRFAFMMARTVRARETAASRGCWRKEGDDGKGAEGARGTNKVMVVVSETFDSVVLKVSAGFSHVVPRVLVCFYGSICSTCPSLLCLIDRIIQ